MDISGMTVSTVAGNTAQSEMSVAVLRKVLDNQQATAAQMVESIEQVPRANPDNLGTKLDVIA